MASRAAASTAALLSRLPRRAVRPSAVGAATRPPSRPSTRGLGLCPARLLPSSKSPGAWDRVNLPLRDDEPDFEPAHTASASRPESESPRPPLPENPAAYYQISFTCVPCGHRSHHNISKQGYHKGSILITCPGCRDRHVISDHLGIFGDRKITVEDLMRERGRLVKRGSLGEDGDIEFWPNDATDQSPAKPAAGPGEADPGHDSGRARDS